MVRLAATIALALAPRDAPSSEAPAPPAATRIEAPAAQPTAQPPPASVSDPHGVRIDLKWSAPTSCPPVTAFRAELDRLLARDSTVGTTSILADATARHVRSGWRVTLGLGAPEHAGTRQLDGERCEQAMRMAALVVAIAVDPEAIHRERESVPPPEPAPPEPARAPEPEPAAVTPNAPPRRGGGLRVGGGLSWGALPRIAGLVEASGVVVIRRWSVRLDARLTPPHEVTGSVPGASGRIGLAAGTLLGCFAPRAPRVAFPLCAGLSVGDLWGRGDGVQFPRRQHRLWTAAALSAEVVARIRGPFGLYLRAIADIPFVRRRFSLAGQMLYTVSAVDVGVRAGVEWRWGQRIGRTAGKTHQNPR